jgi:methylated-DNA-protein-cysteine methyltransferase-like protein
MPYDPEHHGPHRIVGRGFHARVWAMIRTVPAGAVTTYGDVAAALGARSVARKVGHALAALPDTAADVPWHRVVQGSGRISGAPDEERARRQAAALRAEGICVDTNGQVQDFARSRHVFGRAAP